MTELLYGGIAALQRAIRFVENKFTALDVSCGSSGRFIEELLKKLLPRLELIFRLD